MEDCIFCKIIKGEIPCHNIYENKKVFAFLDINPACKGHTLVIPKEHFVNVFDCSDDYLSEVIKAIKLISNHYKKTLDCDGVNILNASGKEAQQSVFHLHFHILPRFEDDGYDTWPNTGYQKEDLEKLKEKIKLDK